MQSIQNDLQFCLETLGLNDKQTDEMLDCCENLGAIPVEYFCEEFIFDTGNPDDIERLHDNEFLNIAEFNSLYWEG